MKKRKGFTIVYTMFFILLIILIITAFASFSYSGLGMAGRACDTMRAYYVAEAGLAKKAMELKTGNTSSTTGIFTIGTGNAAAYSVAVTLVTGGVFSTYKLDSTGTYHGISKNVSLTLRQVSCAKFSYLSNDEDRMFWWGETPIWFVTGDILTGPVYSNDQFNISGGPIFGGPVSSAASSINYYHGGPPEDNPVFDGSLTLGAPIVQLPAFSGNVKIAAQNGGLYLTGNTTVALLADGTMNVTNSARHWTNQNTPLPANGALFVSGGHVDVSGTISGQLTLGTNNNIYVMNNIRYSSDPRVNSNSQDLLGLIAQNNVYVDAGAPYNLEIDAYIIALNTSFTVVNYQTTLKGILTVYGGMTQQRRGPIGTFNSNTNQKVSGYTKDYEYDERLEGMAPPYFPPARDSIGVIYAKILWSES